MKFVPNRAFEAQMRREAAYRAGLLAAAKPAEEAAKRIVRIEAYEEGDLHDSIEAVGVKDEVLLRATDWKANWYEFGSAKNRTVAMLRRGAIAAGLRFKRASK